MVKFWLDFLQNQKELPKAKFNANGFCKGFHCGNKMTNPYKIITNECRFGNDKMNTSKATAFRKRKQIKHKEVEGELNDLKNVGIDARYCPAVVRMFLRRRRQYG